MITKILEIRDRGTFMPIMATRLEPTCEADRYLLARAGYGQEAKNQSSYIFVQRLDGGVGRGSSDPYEHGGARTLTVAHDHLIKHFDECFSGAVIDVEFILGESAKPKESEALAGVL